MKKNLKVALYNPYLDVLGGGEKHILSIIRVLDEEGFRPYIFWDKNLTTKIKQQLSLQFTNKLEFLPNLFKIKVFGLSTLRTLRILKTFDYFFYVTDGSYFVSTAKKNFVFVMVPDKKLYQMNLVNKIKTANFKFISNSIFTQRNLKKWGIASIVIPPFVDQKLIDSNVGQPREKIILTVGRFFGHLHSKKQDLIIKAYKKLKKQNNNFSEFKLILAGGLKEEDKKYFQDLKNQAGEDKNIIFKPNIPLDELYKLYEFSTYFWHFAGYGVNEIINPDKVEHFGLAPLEAMAAGSLVFCYEAGGPKETIKDGENGFLFKDEKELIEKMTILNSNQKQQKIIRQNSQKFVLENFSYKIFKERVKKIIL